MPEFTVEFEVYCSCGAGLCNQSDGGTGRKYPFVTVKPCEKCLEQARDEGWEKGYAEGLDEGSKGGAE